MQRCARTWILCLALAAWPACASPPAAEPANAPANPANDAPRATDPAADHPAGAPDVHASAPIAPPPPLDLTRAWATLDVAAFERELVRATPAHEQRALSGEQRAELARALDGARATALRAALILGRARDPAGLELLLAWLERRDANAPEEVGEIAARALAPARGSARGPRREIAPAVASRLDALARGAMPHPRWSVRIECAASAVELGRTEALPFLLGVLAWGSTSTIPPGAAALDPDLVAALQRRAAEVVSARAGTDVRFEPYASSQARSKETKRLEALLRAPGARR